MTQFGQEISRSSRLGEVLAVPVVYVIGARIGQVFAIEPGNITPVWIPSGIMLAWVLIRGYYIWPGIFLGAFLGNSWAYLSAESGDALLSTMLAGSFNGIGDTLCAVGACFFMRKYFQFGDPFKSLNAFLGLMVFGVVLGPLLSAIFGVSSLQIFGILPSDVYGASFVTWWLGDGVGVLLLTPLILAFAHPEDDIEIKADLPEAVFFAFAVMLYPIVAYSVGADDFQSSNLPYILIPILFWSLIRFGLRISFSVTLFFTICLIWLELLGLGPFVFEDQYLRIMALQIFVLSTVSSIFVIGSLLFERDRSYHLLNEKNQHDPLTKIYNRQYFDTQLLREIGRAERYKKSFSIIMFDIDFFKKVNDKYGHQVGDEVLIKLSGLVAKKIRDIDTLARWGGEEFMILMPETNEQGATLFAERIRAEVEKSKLAPHDCVTISLGVAEANPEATEELEVLGLLNRVDAALYLAKTNGRNQVQVAHEALTSADA